MAVPNDPQHLNLEQQRKRAKDLRRAHRDGSIDAAVRIARHLPRARTESPEQLLASTFTLSEAQLVVAREAGFSSWPKLKHHIEQSQLDAQDLAERIIDAAFAGNDEALRDALSHSPELQSIYVAAVLADADTALALIDADPSLVNRQGGRRHWTPLLYLSFSQYRRSEPDATAARIRIARRLIEAGAAVNATGRELGYVSFNVTLFDQEEWHPIEAAAGQLGSPELVRLLLDAGGDLNHAPIALSQAVRGGSGEALRLMLETNHPDWQVIWALKACAVLGKKDMAKILAPHIAPPMATNEPALTEAIRLGRDAGFIDLLIGADDAPELSGPIRQRAYRAAVRYGHNAAAEVLRRRGAGDDEVTQVDRVIGACLNQNGPELRRLMAQSPDFRSALRANDHRMLTWAVRSGRHGAVPLLLEAGLDPNVPDGDGETALHLAVRGDSLETVDALLHAGANSNARNFDMATPLDIAAAADKPRETLIRRLLESGASPVQEGSVLDRDEMNVMFERAADAVAFGDLDTLRELLDDEPSLVHARSPRPHRATLLNYCGANGVEAPRQRTPANAPAILQLLLDRGADVDATCNLYGGGATTVGLLLSSIHPLRAGLNTELFEILLKHGTILDGAPGAAGISGAAALGRLDLVKNFVNATIEQRQAAFAWAAQYGRTSVVDFLLGQGVDIDAQNGYRQSAVHLAALGGRLDTVQLLVNRGAQLEFRNVWGGTTLESTLWAAINHDPTADYVPIVEALLKGGAKVQSGLTDWWREQKVLVPSAKPRIEELLRRYEGTIPIRH